MGYFSVSEPAPASSDRVGVRVTSVSVWKDAPSECWLCGALLSRRSLVGIAPVFAPLIGNGENFQRQRMLHWALQSEWQHTTSPLRLQHSSFSQMDVVWCGCSRKNQTPEEASDWSSKIKPLLTTTTGTVWGCLLGSWMSQWFMFGIAVSNGPQSFTVTHHFLFSLFPISLKDFRTEE